MELFRRPRAREVFAAHGMGCVGCMGVSMESIEDGPRCTASIRVVLSELNRLPPLPETSIDDRLACIQGAVPVGGGLVVTNAPSPTLPAHVLECYGVVGWRPRTFAKEWLHFSPATMFAGGQVQQDGDQLDIRLHVIVEYAST